MFGQWRGMLALLVLAFAWLPAAGSPAELMGVATAVALGAVALLLVTAQPAGDAPRILVRGRALRERAERSAFLRTRDPDADGRVRPRAPGRSAAV
jgi:hypothetical protein